MNLPRLRLSVYLEPEIIARLTELGFYVWLRGPPRCRRRLALPQPRPIRGRIALSLRMTEATGFEAKTIHRCWKWTRRAAASDADNPLACDLLVVSMVC
jgi:hypothetical protein